MNDRPKDAGPPRENDPQGDGYASIGASLRAFLRSPEGVAHLSELGLLFVKKVRSAAEAIAPHYGKIIAAVTLARDVVDRIEQLPARSKRAMALAGEQGWYFGWHDSLSSVDRLATAVTEAAPDGITDVMLAYYRENLETFELELCSRFPERAAPIRAAVMAHRELGEAGYLLSIPVFIAQADGILSKVADVSSGMNKQGKFGIKAAIKLRELLANDEMAMELADPVFQLHQTMFLMSAEDRARLTVETGNSFNALNRHRVMHGEDPQYGCEVNSLKAFSLLVYVGCHVPELLRDRSDTNRPDE